MAVTWSSSGPGGTASAGYNPSVGVSFTHTVVANTLMVIAAVGRCGGQSGSGQSIHDCTVTGVTPTFVGVYAIPAEQYLALWWAVVPTAGAKTVAAAVGDGNNTGRSMILNSAAYLGVNSVGTVASATGTGTSPTVSVTPATSNDMMFGAIGDGGNVSIGSFSGTQRYNANDGVVYSAAAYGDAAGTASAISATLSASTGWAAVALPLLGAATAAPTNAFFEMF